MPGFNFGPRLEQRHEQRLTLQQKQMLETLVHFRLELRHLEFPEALPGLPGMEMADSILKNKQVVGILIGGVVEELWKKKRNDIASLDIHKDVDVMVMPGNLEPFQSFEGGIDWWTPFSQRLTVRSGSGMGSLEKNFQWWSNANGMVLSFGINSNVDFLPSLSPGLYIPDLEFIINLRMAEALAQLDPRIAQTEDSDMVWEKFEEKLRKSLEGNLPKEVAIAFSGQVLDYRYEDDYRKFNALQLITLENEQLVAIKDYLKSKY